MSYTPDRELDEPNRPSIDEERVERERIFNEENEREAQFRGSKIDFDQRIENARKLLAEIEKGNDQLREILFK